MMSPRSFLVSRQNQHLRPSASQQAATPSTSSSASPNNKDGRESYTVVGSSITSITNTRIAVKQRQMARAQSSPSPSPPKPTTTLTRPTTPTSPVQIPTKVNNNSRDGAHALNHRNRRNREERRERSSSPRWTELHSSDSIPPSVAALLAVTSIPRPRSTRRLRQRSAMEKCMTVESIIQQTQETEKELSLDFIRSPMHVLLSPPDDSDSDDYSIGDSTLASAFSTRAVSLESVPSLTDSFVTNSTLPSVETPQRLTRGRRKSRPTRRSLTPVSSPPGEQEEHPLSLPVVDIEDLDFRVFESPPEGDKTATTGIPFRPFKSAFKSNLTASLRALRNAARSFSSINLPSIPADDFLTRSILTMDPQVPYTDERMPPALDEEPTAALRRYLNPTQTARLESQTPPLTTESAQSAFTASIQMQTYKVHRSRSAPPSSSRIQISMSPRSSRGNQPARGKEAAMSFPPPGSGPRQREMRENSDFIRVAVMEMAMRKSGKLDDQRPGRARWALPPRKLSTKPYEVGTNGVPARWVPVTYR